MSTDKTVIIEPGINPSEASGNTDNEFKTLSTPSEYSNHKFNTILSETTVVTGDKICFLEEELKKLIAIEESYDINESFAEGGQGIISTGKDKILNRYVAIKSLKSDYLDNQQVITNFITEAKITAQLDHPSIIPLYSINSSEVDEGLHLSMKLIHGHNLKELNQDTALLCAQYRKNKIREIEQSVLKERLDDFIKVCDAISFAHNKKVLHNDLKPDNIMIGEFHEVYVMDWGIASVFKPDDEGNSEREKETVNKIAGTPGFIAPEVVVGEQPSPASDQYALGMILFELMTLKPGMTGSSIKEVFEKTRDGALESFSHRFHQCKISKDLIAVVKKATALRPEERYSNVSAMAEDIRRFLLDEELSARPDDLPRKITRLILKHKNLAATFILLILLAFSGVTIFSLIKKNQAEIESKKRAVKMVNLHSKIENNAHFIDRHLFHIAHILSRFADKTLFTIKDDEVSNQKIYFDASILKKDKGLPPGTKYSPAYQRNINLDAFNYTLAPGLKLETAEHELRKISTIQPDFLKYLINSDSDDLVFENLVKGKQRVVNEGLPICWIYLAFDDGLMINFPAAPGLPENYDPRERPWYKDTKKQMRIKWNNPYVDISGLGVIITASKSLYDEQGTFYGVAGVDMTFDYITKTLMCGECKNPSILTRYLIDSHGKVILYNELGAQQLKEAEKSASEIKFKPFPFPEIKKHIKKKKSGQFEVNSNGKTILIGYAPVKTLGWYYVETVDHDQYMSME